ncbi:hypothetical protein [Thermaurantiacus sp.]
MQTKPLMALLGLVLAALSAPAHAYIGPGAGVGAILVTVGVIAALVMAFFAIMWYPLKRLLKKRQGGGGSGPKA